MDVDIDLPAPRRSNANARVCRDARGGNGSIRRELAARVSDIRRAMINGEVGTSRRALYSPGPEGDFRLRWPSRLVATAAEDRLSVRAAR
jgi:hypothetical protein